MSIRVARNIPNVSGDIWKQKGSVLIIGSPGSGKTTFLRDLIMHRSDYQNGAIAVVDERRELFPVWGGKYIFPPGKRTDVLSGCRKEKGLEIALRTLGPSVIAVDEITNAEDCAALSHAAWCGVKLIATAHAGSKEELYSRSIYRSILDKKLFDTLIVLNREKKWHQEVMGL
jgi:stage III sporulation protein AA